MRHKGRPEALNFYVVKANLYTGTGTGYYKAHTGSLTIFFWSDQKCQKKRRGEKG